jgi:hypothetical protein
MSYASRLCLALLLCSTWNFAWASIPCTPDERLLPVVKWDATVIEGHGYRVFARALGAVRAGAPDQDLMAWKVSPLLPNWPDDGLGWYRWGETIFAPLTRYFDFPAGVEVKVYVAQYDVDGRYSYGSNDIALCWPEVRRFP